MQNIAYIAGNPLEYFPGQLLSVQENMSNNQRKLGKSPLGFGGDYLVFNGTYNDVTQCFEVQLSEEPHVATIEINYNPNSSYGYIQGDLDIENMLPWHNGAIQILDANNNVLAESDTYVWVSQEAHLPAYTYDKVLYLTNNTMILRHSTHPEYGIAIFTDNDNIGQLAAKVSCMVAEKAKLLLIANTSSQKGFYTYDVSLDKVEALS